MKFFVYIMALIITFQQYLYANMNDDPLITMLQVDKLEWQDTAEHTRKWDGSFWAGYDLNKLYIYSEGEYTSQGLEKSRNELLYSRAISPFWDMQMGLVYDKNANSSRKWAEFSFAGLAPYYFETRASLFFNTKGNIGLHLTTEYELMITQQLIISPSLEAELYTKDDPELERGKGVSSLEVGLRMRYEFIREFAPYIGIEWGKTFGKTYNFNPKNNTHAVAGVSFWF
ncbi:MAG: copper resistance protein B [Sulfurimonas sp.]